ncbi:MAG: hypothetical protein UZ21_OP11001000372 [Microgenomates bacterium OLB22]|nr:MAG: hypothetical protein UZ21_OP11001000372 [Microgenomates bacterium OLB22]
MERSHVIRNSLFGATAVLALVITSVFTLQRNRTQSQAQAATQATISQVLRQNGISSDTVQSCPEGIAEPLIRACGEPQCGDLGSVTSVNTAGNPTSVDKPACTISIEFAGVRCMDGTVVDYKPFGEGCIPGTKEEFSSRFSEIGEEMRALCAGKKAASCSPAGSSGQGTGPGSAGSQVNGGAQPSTTNSSGDVNGDGVVDLLDYSVWLNAFTSTSR